MKQQRPPRVPNRRVIVRARAGDPRAGAAVAVGGFDPVRPESLESRTLFAGMGFGFHPGGWSAAPTSSADAAPAASFQPARTSESSGSAGRGPRVDRATDASTAPSSRANGPARTWYAVPVATPSNAAEPSTSSAASPAAASTGRGGGSEGRNFAERGSDADRRADVDDASPALFPRATSRSGGDPGSGGWRARDWAAPSDSSTESSSSATSTEARESSDVRDSSDPFGGGFRGRGDSSDGRADYRWFDHGHDGNDADADLPVWTGSTWDSNPAGPTGNPLRPAGKPALPTVADDAAGDVEVGAGVPSSVAVPVTVIIGVPLTPAGGLVVVNLTPDGYGAEWSSGHAGRVVGEGRFGPLNVTNSEHPTHYDADGTRGAGTPTPPGRVPDAVPNGAVPAPVVPVDPPASGSAKPSSAPTGDAAAAGTSHPSSGGSGHASPLRVTGDASATAGNASESVGQPPPVGYKLTAATPTALAVARSADAATSDGPAARPAGRAEAAAADAPAAVAAASPTRILDAPSNDRPAVNLGDRAAAVGAAVRSVAAAAEAQLAAAGAQAAAYLRLPLAVLPLGLSGGAPGEAADAVGGGGFEVFEGRTSEFNFLGLAPWRSGSDVTDARTWAWNATAAGSFALAVGGYWYCNAVAARRRELEQALAAGRTGARRKGGAANAAAPEADGSQAVAAARSMVGRVDRWCRDRIVG